MRWSVGDMDTAGIVLDVLGPVVVIVACGAIAGPKLRIDVGTLSRLAYWILGPALMFDALSTTELQLNVVGSLALAGLGGMTAAGLVAFASSRVAGDRYGITAASVMCSGYGNVGNAGLAVSAFALGDEMLPAAGVFMLAINVSGMMLGVGLAHGRSGSLVAAVIRSITAPMTIAGILALVVNAFALEVPRLASRTIHLTSGALIPVMLFALGLQLQMSTGLRVSRPIVVVASAKLVVAPIAAAMVAAAVGLTGDLLAVTIIQSAMPPAVFCMVVAMEHDLEAEEVTSMVVLTTGLSLVTLPVILFFLT